MAIYNDGYFDEAYIRDILSMHPAECVFELDAPQNIEQRLSVKTKHEWHESFRYQDDEQLRKNLQEFRACWHLSEIYCPHEGIDRLAECGVRTLDWEMA